MVKKVVIVTAGVLLLAFVLCGTSVVSYVRTSAGYVSDAVAESVPVEFEIERARGMIGDLIKDVRTNMHAIAKEEVRVKQLEEQIDRAEAQLAKDKGQMMRLQSDLQSANDVYRYVGRTYTANQVRIDLANRLTRYKTRDATLLSWREIHTARKNSLEAARTKLEGMLAAKRQLEVDVENLEAKTQMIAAAKATSNYQFDDGRLGQVKELVSSLRTRLEVAENLVHAETRFHDEIPLDETNPEDIVEQVTQYFGEKDSPEPNAIALD